MKGISPLIAIILLIAFAVGAGGVFSLWITGFTSTQTSTVGGTGEKVIKCASSALDIDTLYNKTFTPVGNATHAGFGLGMTAGDFNLSVKYYSGTEDLYNFTIILVDSNNVVGKEDHVRYNKTDAGGTYPMKPGEKYTFRLTLDTNFTKSPIKKVRVSALCQDTFTVFREESV